MAWDEFYRNPEPSVQLMLRGMGLEGEFEHDEAIDWVNEHPEEWAYMVDNARRLVMKNGWVSINYLVNMVRNERNVSVRNGFGPTLSRLMERTGLVPVGAFRKHAARADGYV